MLKGECVSVKRKMPKRESREEKKREKREKRKERKEEEEEERKKERKEGKEKGEEEGLKGCCCGFDFGKEKKKVCIFVVVVEVENV